MKKHRRLQLHRETVRHLGDDSHRVVAGALITQPACNSLGFSACITECFTACGQHTCGPCAFSIEPKLCRTFDC